MPTCCYLSDSESVIQVGQVHTPDTNVYLQKMNHVAFTLLALAGNHLDRA